MGFNPYPSVRATKREAERSQQFVPALRMDDRVPQLSVGPTPLSPEMGRIQSKVGNVSLHDPDCPSGVGGQSQCAHYITPVGGRRDGIFQLGIRPYAFRFGKSIHTRTLTGSSDISVTEFELQVVGTRRFELLLS
jgi:hypothetical protein